MAKARRFQLSAAPATVLAHLLVIAVATLVLVWLLKFQDGVALSSDNKQKIFNVSTRFPLLLLLKEMRLAPFNSFRSMIHLHALFFVAAASAPDGNRIHSRRRRR